MGFMERSERKAFLRVYNDGLKLAKRRGVTLTEPNLPVVHDIAIRATRETFALNRLALTPARANDLEMAALDELGRGAGRHHTDMIRICVVGIWHVVLDATMTETIEKIERALPAWPSHLGTHSIRAMALAISRQRAIDRVPLVTHDEVQENFFGQMMLDALKRWAPATASGGEGLQRFHERTREFMTEGVDKVEGRIDMYARQAQRVSP